MPDKKRTAVEAEAPATENKNIITADIITQVIEKINTKSIKSTNQKIKVIAEPTAQALHVFCRQSEEFARAIVQTDKTFEDCLKAVADGLKDSAVSDIEVYQSAVNFFFPGAKVEFKMMIHMSEYELAEPEPKKSIELSFDSLIDW